MNKLKFYATVGISLVGCANENNSNTNSKPSGGDTSNPTPDKPQDIICREGEVITLIQMKMD